MEHAADIEEEEEEGDRYLNDAHVGMDGWSPTRC
jgi:hypothetical protein